MVRPWKCVHVPLLVAFHTHLLFHITEASNAGGVAVSGLEMAQNSQRLTWASEDVDAKLKGIMADCYKVCLSFQISQTLSSSE